MSNLKILSDSELLKKTEAAVAEERESTDRVLSLLREVGSRRLYAKLGFSSLFDFCTKHLKYCNASAQLRIDAARLSEELPEVREALKEGHLTLSSVGSFQKFIRRETKSYSKESKRDILKKISDQTKEQTERILCGISPLAIPKESTKVLTLNETEIRFVADDELLQLIKQMRAKLCVKGISDASHGEIFREALMRALGTKNTRSIAKSTSPGEVKRSQVRPYISTHIIRQVREKAQHRCTYVSSATGRHCHATLGLQVEHTIPFAMGGSSGLSNLTLLCAAHNRLRAIEQLGKEKMSTYINVR